jgi:hypothetical protein
MPALVAGIHALVAKKEDVDARLKAGHDEWREIAGHHNSPR